MIDRTTIHQDVEDGMMYLENLETIELDPYFDTRLEARIRRLERENQVSPLPFFKTVPRLAFVILLCLINLVAIIYIFRGISKPAGPVAPFAEAYVDTLDTAYSVDQNALDIVLIKSMKESPGGG